VEKSIYGETPETIAVVIPHYSRLTTNYEGITYSADFMEPHYLNPDFEKSYIVFLRHDDQSDIYTPASVPFNIEITQSKTIALQYQTGEQSKQVIINSRESIAFSYDSYDWSRLDQITGESSDKFIASLLKEFKYKKQ
jgi:hypothetical protein